MAHHFRPFGNILSHMARGNWAREPGDGEAAPVLRVTGALSVVGAICVVLQWQQPAAVLWSLACWTSGGLVGFLFGIPRTSQVEDPDRTYRQHVNTNLEQISDWLTKIIVGLGLIELQRMPEFIWRAGARVAASVGNAQADVSSGIALVLYFGVVGFFLGYLLTRLYLAGAFSRADREAAGFDQKISALEDTLSRSEAEDAMAPPEVKRPPGSTKAPPPKVHVDPDVRRKRTEYTDEFKRITSTEIPAREKIVLVGVLVERMLLEFATDLRGATPETRHRSPVLVIRELAEQELVSREEATAFQEFWQVRNEAVHGRFEISDTQAARVLDLAWRLIRVFV